ncbi:phospholipase D-like domain-containing protein [Parapedobacter pyrenivorans]|uniref:phospholipase D-like domain-containing protein n=1 Tax=Parapedobacter pyrenivorans TaxID=1305674 RepID=UPI00333F077B
MPRRRKVNRNDFIPNHKVRLLLGGKAYFDLLIELIEHAQEHIHLQIYIYEADTTGQQIADALIAAARRGVAVHILVDGYGSQDLDKSFIAQFQENGIHFRVFEPLLRSKKFYVGRRMHQKIMVIDARYAIVTGANIGDKYNDRPDRSAWLDFALCVEGEIATSLCGVCWMTWKNFQPLRRVPDKWCTPARTVVDFGYENSCAVRMRRNDWVRRKYEITSTYREIFQRANDQVILVSSYFLPGHTARKYIEKAIRRGVGVKLLICSRMDVPLVKDAERFMYDWLLQLGVEIYEYAGDMLHGKLATCDGHWMTIGSFNVNDLSARVSIELNLDVKGDTFVKRTIGKLEHIMENQCVRIKSEDFESQNSPFNRIKRWASFKILRFIFFLGTFYMKQEKRGRD